MTIQERYFKKIIEVIDTATILQREAALLAIRALCEEAMTVKDSRKKANEESDESYKLCIEFWLKEFHKDFTFGGQQGKAMKSIIKRMKSICISRGLEGTTDQIVASFKKMCLNLPEWYKDKDLPTIDSKINEIIHQIIAGKKNDNFHSKNSAQRFSEFAG